jgi:hypothetical protein
MLFEISMTRSYVVREAARATVEAASKEEAIEAAWHDWNDLPWETTDEEPNQDTEVTCELVQGRRPDFRAVGGALVAREP